MSDCCVAKPDDDMLLIVMPANTGCMEPISSAMQRMDLYIRTMYLCKLERDL
jgi:hypothetical protein